ncbi:septation ring formation regulator EzrA [Streptococcus ovuberis]|uniref:Septation ring formation regulator EzrA n=1 Tax=Streptococcus ovuberis TaxID=1936207 RepID=A0A7X6N2T5_9STRE|nr:septation ring formation regulator EzrA [Streptococcus ovuberis]NKZ21114.1 septation ring formation regulator EzrA [Streptococcus ovuberis]
MSSGMIITIIVIVTIIILAYVLSILARKRNETLLDQLEERKEALFNLPVNDEIEEVKNLHLIGQSQVTFREWNQKWVDLSLNTFADIENQIFETEGFNQSFRFLKAKTAIENIDSQINLVSEDIAEIRQALVDLKEQEAKNSGRVRHALDLFDDLQQKLSENEASYGSTLPELQKQFKHIESEFSEFVTLNTSGDPIEASAILDKTEEHMIALSQIMDRLPNLMEKLVGTMPEQLDDLNSGYRKLLEENYQFPEDDIEVRLQNVRSSIKDNLMTTVNFDLDRADAENERIQDEIDSLYEIFTKEISAKQEVSKLSKVLPDYIAHIEKSQSKLQGEVERLRQSYYLSESKLGQIQNLVAEFKILKEDVQHKIDYMNQPDLAYSQILDSFKAAQLQLSDTEEGLISLADYLNSQEEHETNARNKANGFVNRLHTIKRYMEKRNLPGIPQSFVNHFFDSSNKVEAFLGAFEPQRIDMEAVNRQLEMTTTAMEALEEEAYQIVQDASLTEQLLQYANRYRSQEPAIQDAFTASLVAFEQYFDYALSFQTISEALERVEPGVTERFVNSYIRTREVIR